MIEVIPSANKNKNKIGINSKAVIATIKGKTYLNLSKRRNNDKTKSTSSRQIQEERISTAGRRDPDSNKKVKLSRSLWNLEINIVEEIQPLYLNLVGAIGFTQCYRNPMLSANIYNGCT